jgi:hypothetical protein
MVYAGDLANTLEQAQQANVQSRAIACCKSLEHAVLFRAAGGCEKSVAASTTGMPRESDVLDR